MARIGKKNITLVDVLARLYRVEWPGALWSAVLHDNVAYEPHVRSGQFVLAKAAVARELLQCGIDKHNVAWLMSQQPLIAAASEAFTRRIADEQAGAEPVTVSVINRCLVSTSVSDDILDVRTHTCTKQMPAVATSTLVVLNVDQLLIDNANEVTFNGLDDDAHRTP